MLNNKDQIVNPSLSATGSNEAVTIQIVDNPEEFKLLTLKNNQFHSANRDQEKLVDELQNATQDNFAGSSNILKYGRCPNCKSFEQIGNANSKFSFYVDEFNLTVKQRVIAVIFAIIMFVISIVWFHYSEKEDNNFHLLYPFTYFFSGIAAVVVWLILILPFLPKEVQIVAKKLNLQ